MGLISRRGGSRWLVPLLTALLATWVSAVSAAPAAGESTASASAPSPAQLPSASEREPESLRLYQGGAFLHPDLERALSEWPQVSGGATYTALRELWQTWDRAQPAQVEEALREVSLDPRLTPAQRANAELLGAYARLRRGDDKDARRRIQALGYVDQWLVLGPFDNTGKSGFETAQGPEPELAEPIAWGRGYAGKDGRQVRWRVVPPAFPFGWVDAGALLRPRQQMCAFFASYVSQPELKQRRAISLWLGSRGAARLFWNGVERLVDPGYRGHDFDRRAATVWLEPGENRVTIKVCGDDTAPLVSLRLADPSGKPDPALHWRADSSALSRLAPAGRGPAPPGRVEGPLQWFERSLRAAATPALREAFARYLTSSDGDDPTTHQARDLAHAAASAAPSVPRLLLAAELAEDRNEQARWLERARTELPRSAPRDVRRNLEQLLLSEARWLEQGVNPRAALPMYEQLLALDPDDVRALSGRARIYDSAGLKHAALASIEQALARSPHAVALINMAASGLAELGEAEQARSMESLYSALRFDDHGPLVDALQLGVQTRDRRSVDHWTSRLSALSPDSGWVNGMRARAFRQLGDSERTLESYDRALALAPDDVEMLRELSDLHGELGHAEAQIGLLRRVLGLTPEDNDVRQYVSALEPSVEHSDEAYAWKPERFLPDRLAAAAGQHRRTLLDLTVTHVYENGLAGQFRQIVFQPLTAAGAEMGRQYSFTFQADRQRAQLRHARVYRASGTVDEAVDSGEGPADNPELSMYTSARTVYVQFPRLEPGDVVELQYRIDDSGERGEFAGYFGELEYLQSEVPVAHAEYVVIVPKERKLYVDVQRLPQLKQSEETRGAERVYSFRADGVPGVEPEPAMPPWSEVLGFVHVSTYPSYRDLGAWYWGLSRDQLELDGATRELAQRIAQGATTPRAKVEAVYNWVVKNTRYVALEFGIYGYKPRRSVQTVTRGWGDCKDKAAVIVSLLDALDVPATMVLVRTGLRGRFRSQVASLAPFDHAIAYVPELDLYLDGTAEFSGSGELPAMDQGALALRVLAGDAQLVTLPDNDPTRHVERRQVELRLSSNGGAELALSYETTGASASAWRRRYLAEATRTARVQEDLAREFPGLELAEGASAIQVSDLSNFEQPVSVRVRARSPQVLRVEGQVRTLVVTPSDRLGSRYASLSRRDLEVDIGAVPALDETFVVQLAPGQSVLSLPKPKQGESPFGQYSVEASVSGNEVRVHSRLALRVSRVSPQSYVDFRRFCQAADAAFEQRLVLGMNAR
ncbi:MAG: hypothetical protein RL685_5902 [Pseudomonadota bacterium]